MTGLSSALALHMVIVGIQRVYIYYNEGWLRDTTSFIEEFVLD